MSDNGKPGEVRIDFADPNQTKALLMGKIREMDVIVRRANAVQEAAEAAQAAGQPPTPGAGAREMFELAKVIAASQMVVMGALFSVLETTNQRVTIPNIRAVR